MRALNIIFTPCSRQTNCWLRLFYHSILSFWWWNDWERQKSWDWPRKWIWKNHMLYFKKISFNKLCILILATLFWYSWNAASMWNFFWKTNFNLEAILPCNKPTPLYLPCLVVEDEGTSSISIVNWGSHSSLLQHTKRWSWVWPPVPKSWSKGEGSKQTPLKDWQDIMEGSLSHNWKK